MRRRRYGRRSWLSRGVVVLGLLTTLGLLAAAGGVAYGRWKVDQIPEVQVVLRDAASGAPENYLVVGSDSRDNIDPDDSDAGGFLDGSAGGQRSDSLIIARIAPDDERVDMISLPRDLWVEIAHTGEMQRINTAYTAGRQQLIDTIELDFGVEINHYIEVDFPGFTNLVEAIGGIPMYFDTAMRDFDSGLQINGAGCVRLDGEQALALARARHLQYLNSTGTGWVTDPSGDLGRITRQQILVLKAVERAVAIDLASPARLNEVIDVAINHVGVDEGTTFDDIVDLVERFQNVTDETLSTHALPVEAFTTAGGADVLQMLEAEAEPILNVFRGLGADTVTPATVSVDVRNGSGVEGQADAVRLALEAVGFTVDSTANAEGIPPAATTISFPPDLENQARLLARHLTSGAELVADSALGGLVLTTGIDFTTVMEHPGPETDDAVVSAADPSEAEDSVTTTTEHDPNQVRDLVGKTPGDEPPGIDCG